jgi:hypothetical protein
VVSNLLSERIMAVSPICDPAEIAALAHYELLGTPELAAAEAEANAAVLRWVEAPENAVRTIRDAPQDRDRIAIGSPQEQRTWWE